MSFPAERELADIFTVTLSACAIITSQKMQTLVPSVANTKEKDAKNAAARLSHLSISLVKQDINGTILV